MNAIAVLSVSALAIVTILPGVTAENLLSIMQVHVSDGTAGSPIGDAQITVVGSDGTPMQTTRTDRNGSAAIQLGTGVLRLDVSAPYYRTERTFVAGVPSVEMAFNLSPAPERVLLRGAVTYRGTETPAVNASILITGPMHMMYLLPGTLLTDRHGFFSVPVPEGEYFLTVAAGSAYRPGSWHGNAREQMDPITIDLGPQLDIAVPWRASIEATKASDIEAVTISIVPRDGAIASPALVYPDASGAIGGLLPPGTYSAIAAVEGTSFRIGDLSVPTAADASLLIDRESFRRVWITDEENVPIAGAVVDARGSPDAFQGVTDHAGIVRVPSSSYTARLSAPGHESRVVTFPSGGSDIDAVLQTSPTHQQEFTFPVPQSQLREATFLVVDFQNRTHSSRTNHEGDATINLGTGPCFTLLFSSRYALESGQVVHCEGPPIAMPAARSSAPVPVRLQLVADRDPTTGTLVVWNSAGKAGYATVTVPGVVRFMENPGAVQVLFIARGMDPRPTELIVPFEGLSTSLAIDASPLEWAPDEETVITLLDAEPLQVEQEGASAGAGVPMPFWAGVSALALAAYWRRQN